MDPSIMTNPGSSGRQLDTPPPSPPRNNKSLVAMGMGPGSGDDGSVDMSNPAVKVMALMGQIKNNFLELQTYLPTIAQGLQQIVMGLEQVVPQQVADMVAGNPPGSTGSGLGAPGAAQAPVAPPPVQTGMP